MEASLVTRLVPILGRSLHAEFNVFDVMRHGTHEKQLSNVFAWLLEASGTHGLGDRFLRIFLDEVNSSVDPLDAFTPETPYRVRQEVNTSAIEGADIADIVLESTDATIVIENYFTSDGHGHSYDGYLRYGERDGQRAVVALICYDEDRSLLSAGWEQAAVITYGNLVGRLLAEVDSDPAYRQVHPEAHSFIVQMHRKLAKGRSPMEDRDVLDFVIAMCDADEAGRYARRPIDKVAEQFANDIAQQALERFTESRTLLQKIKDRLRAFTDVVLAPQLVAALPPNSIGRVNSNWSGIWLWSVFFNVGEGADRSNFAIMFGPSAWQQGAKEGTKVDSSSLYLWHDKTQRLRRSTVSLQDVLDGLDAGDTRLRDETLEMVGVRLAPNAIED